MKKIMAIAVLIVSLTAIGILFWYNEWRYSLPTPLPAQYHAIFTGEHIDVSKKITLNKEQPVFIHFFNPDCPCSKFNVPHFKELVKMYSDKINFAVVVITKDKEYTAEFIQKKYDLTVPVLLDTSLASICGVYSTPQAVLLTAGQQLYYRGNYNRSRYCTDKKSNYAQIAIDSLLGHRQEPAFNSYALTAYGCSLPKCKK